MTGHRWELLLPASVIAIGEHQWYTSIASHLPISNTLASLRSFYLPSICVPALSELSAVLPHTQENMSGSQESLASDIDLWMQCEAVFIFGSRLQ